MGRLRVAALCAWAMAAVAAAGELTANEQHTLRETARAAFRKGDYAAMVRACEPLAAWVMARSDAAANERASLGWLVDRHLDDAMALGHARQLAGDWKGAVAAYGNALHLVDAALGEGVEAGPVRTPQLEQWVRLVLLVGRLQRDQLKDLKSAATTFARVPERYAIFRQTVGHLSTAYEKRMRKFVADQPTGRDRYHSYILLRARMALRELAATQEELGQIAAALDTLAKVHFTGPLHNVTHLGSDVGAVGRLVQKLPVGVRRPPLPMLLVLEPASPSHTLNLDDPAGLARNCGKWSSGRSNYWRFAFSPPPGQEFATLECQVDLEQVNLRHGGQFRIWTRTTGEQAGTFGLGSLGWPRDREAGRDVVAQTFDVPEGAGTIYIEAGVAPGRFIVHNVSVKATFRAWEDLAFRPPGVQPDADVWMQSECLPPDGILTRNGERIRPGTATTGMRPGPYTFTYAVEGHVDTFRCEARFQPGGRYGLFVNLDSPFRWQLTTLRGLSQHPPSRAQVVRRRDGQWFAAYGSDSKILLSTSRDGATWEKPWELPHGAIFDRIEPTLHVDRQGTLWVAFFSNRLGWEPPSTGGYTLWLTHSADGRAWSAPRPLLPGGPSRRSTKPWPELGGQGGWPMCSAHIAEAPDGRAWLFWRGHVASADSLANLREFGRLEVEGKKRPRITDTFVAVAPDGRLHMVFESWGSGIHYTTSKDGLRWAAPELLVEQEGGSRTTNAQLILDGERAALIYETSKGAWLCRGQVEPKPKFGKPIKITNHVIPFNHARVWAGPEGPIGILAGKGTVWLLTADRNTLSRAVHTF